MPSASEGLVTGSIVRAAMPRRRHVAPRPGGGRGHGRGAAGGRVRRRQVRAGRAGQQLPVGRLSGLRGAPASGGPAHLGLGLEAAGGLRRAVERGGGAGPSRSWSSTFRGRWCSGTAPGSISTCRCRSPPEPAPPSVTRSTAPPPGRGSATSASAPASACSAFATGSPGAVGAQLFLPTGDRKAFSSDGSVRFWPQLMAAGRYDRVSWGARLGVHMRPQNDCACDLSPGTELTMGGAGTWRFNRCDRRRSRGLPGHRHRGRPVRLAGGDVAGGPAGRARRGRAALERQLRGRARPHRRGRDPGGAGRHGCPVRHRVGEAVGAARQAARLDVARRRTADHRAATGC